MADVLVPGGRTGTPLRMALLVSAVLPTAVTAAGSAVASGPPVGAWGSYNYGQWDVPAGLSDVVAVAAGTTHDLALNADGTVAAWGANGAGQCSVPSGLTGVIAVEAGPGHSFANRTIPNIPERTPLGWLSSRTRPRALPAAPQARMSMGAPGPPGEPTVRLQCGLDGIWNQSDFRPSAEEVMLTLPWA
jgi:hypothetical protein